METIARAEPAVGRGQTPPRDTGIARVLEAPVQVTEKAACTGSAAGRAQTVPRDTGVSPVLEALHRVDRPGSGMIEVQRIAGRSRVVRAGATSPLKLLSPRTRSEAAWVFTSTYGGGLVGGDAISLELSLGAGTTCLLSTQASTKVYRTTGATCRQQLDAAIGPGAALVCWPDPVVCFARSKFEQRQRFELAADASLVMVDWLTSGRHARGERWAFDRYAGSTEAFVGGRCVFRDALLLDPADGEVGGAMRMGACDCFATILLIGRALKDPIDRLAQAIASQPAPQGAPHSRPQAGPLFSASPIENGLVIRVAAAQTETAARWIHHRLSFVAELLGQDPWARKW